jgi:branched-chain amino acid transport system substrate-binding protein
MSVRFPLALVSALCLAVLAGSCGGGGAGTIRIGMLADCEGIWAFTSGSAYAGAELPLIARGARPLGPKPANGISQVEVAGKGVQLFFGCGDDTAEKTLSEARRLVEQVGVNVLIGPIQIGESFVVRDYARKRPGVAFLDGTAAGQSLTLQDPAHNFFRFSTDGAQWSAGLGAYAYNTLGWRRAVTVAPDGAFEYTQVAGFVAEFCALGGTIVKRVWSPRGDVSRYAARNSADGFYSADPANFTTEFRHLRGTVARRIVGGVFWGNLASTPDILKRAVGVVNAGPGPAESTWPGVREYMSSLGKAYPSIVALEPSIFGIAYYHDMQVVLKALEHVHGDLSGGERRFQTALANVQLGGPHGPTRLDANRQAIAPNYLAQWQRDGKGGYVQRTIRVVPDVDEAFGGYFHANGPQPSRTYPACKHGNPPPWARSG